MPSTSTEHTAGVLVLGMHRSGTSVVSGILDGLGLDGGPRDLMFDADEFNSDGYWEQRPFVALNDTLLRRQGGFASAPPKFNLHPDVRDVDTARPAIREVLSALDGPWFLKDPRQCLLLPFWTEIVGTDDLAVVVNRDPRAVIRSLQHRNGYSVDLAAGLWEHYLQALLASLGTRRCHFIQYDDLLDSPAQVTRELAAVLADHLGAREAPERAGDASTLVRPRSAASSSTATEMPDRIAREQQPLADYLAALTGTHDCFDAGDVPAHTDVGRSAIAWRRRRLRVATRLLGSDADRNARRDRR